MSHFHRNSVFVSLIVASLLLPVGAYADDDDVAAQPVPLPPDCVNVAAFGYVDLLGPILPGKGPEAIGQATFNFGGVSIKNAALA